MTLSRRVKIGVALSVLIALAVASTVLALRPAEVAVIEARRAPLTRTVVSSGRVLPAARIELGVRAPSNVAEVLASEGDRVEAGQLLVRLDDAEARASVAQASASVAQAAVQLRRVRRVAAPLAAETLARAEIDLGAAEQELARAAGLVSAGAYTTAQLEDVQQSVALARSRRTAAQVELESAASGGDERRLALASLAQAEAALELAQARLSQTRITAPFAATVLARDVEAGDLVQPGRVLLVLAGLGPTRLVIEPDERNLAYLELGQRAVASAEAFPARRFEAVVAFIAPAVDPDRGTIEIQLEVEDPPAELRAEMTVSVEIEVASREAALVVPRTAVFDASTQSPQLFVVEDGRVAVREVVLGIADRALVEIDGGLSEGDTVVLDHRAVTAGQRVHPNLRELD